ncbi:MAG: hypothetical protein Q9227_004849 [Pyrenula ochraceoflavens]
MERPSRILTPDATFEGESSLSAHSRFAKDFLGKALGTCPMKDLRLEMDETLAALGHLIDVQKQKSVQYDAVYTETVPTDVYYSNNYTDAQLIIVTVCLHWLFADARPEESSLQEEYGQYSQRCRVSLETTLSRLPLHLPPTWDYVCAVTLGAYYTVQISKPSLAWTLATMASHLCQSLGYHRISTLKNDQVGSRTEKVHVFWAIYVLDKGLSLRLGRPSTIRDSDIPLSLSLEGCESGNRPEYQHYSSQWVRIARIQGKIYENLYSPHALAMPSQDRQEHVVQLVEELESARSNMKLVQERLSQKAQQNRVLHMLLKSEDVVHFSLLTLIYRAMPHQPGSISTFDERCIMAARQTLDLHQNCVDVMHRTDSSLLAIYITWTMLYTPFTPFIVIFCHTIEGADAVDLSRLQSVVVSLQSACEVSEPAAKLHHLFQVLYNVALRYFELATKASTPSQRTPQMQSDHGLSAYLTALGFALPAKHLPDAGSSLARGVAPAVDGSGDGVVYDPSGGYDWTDREQLGDWFYNNKQMMGLLEDDDFHLFG